jgi:hypothetical protein
MTWEPSTLIPLFSVTGAVTVPNEAKVLAPEVVRHPHAAATEAAGADARAQLSMGTRRAASFGSSNGIVMVTMPLS